MDDLEARVLDAIRQGMGRPAGISRATCIGEKQVRKALSSLRKKKLVEMSEREYREATCATKPTF